MEVERPSFWQGLRCVSRTNELPCKTRPKQPQSISMTSPVLRIRICIAFCKLKKVSAQAKPRGKSKEGGRSPLLGRFKGDCQGGEAKLPLDYSFFRPSTALSFSYEKESGVETFASLARQKRMGRRRQLAPSAHPKWAYGAGKNGPPAQKSMYSACKIKKPSQDKPTTVGRG